MKSHRATILVLDDEPGIRTEIRDFLDSGRIRVLLAAAPSEAFSILSGHPVDLAIVDIRLPEMSGLEVLKEIKRKFPGTAVIMMSGHGDMDSVIVALRDGAVDYFKKPFRLQDLLRSVEKNLKVQVAARRLMGTNGAMNFEEAFGNLFSPSMIAVSPAMIAVVEKMHLVARSRDTTVLITGESGTGKELIARGIHQISSRRDMPFHPANCSSIPDELFESEFFGYKKGAFTGATADKPGWFEAADRGTLFLDEVGDLKINLQAKLLRVMDDRQITRLGSTATRRVDVRIITATNQDLEALIEKGRFRADLYHRLNTFVINLPPLRERKEAIPALFGQYLEHYSKKLDRTPPAVDHDIIPSLLLYDFPGNVRELKHMVERALILCEGDRLTLHHFDHLKLKTKITLPAERPVHPVESLSQMEKESILAVLKQTGNNKSQAARLLKISRQALDRKILKLGIELT